jgi:hypothetical protein
MGEVIKSVVWVQETIAEIRAGDCADRDLIGLCTSHEQLRGERDTLRAQLAAAQERAERAEGERDEAVSEAKRWNRQCVAREMERRHVGEALEVARHERNQARASEKRALARAERAEGLVREAEGLVAEWLMLVRWHVYADHPDDTARFPKASIDELIDATDVAEARTRAFLAREGRTP